MRCTYVGHATTLTEMQGTLILSDPHFGSRVLFSKRKVPLSFDPSALDVISAVLISHMHYDHLNTASYKYISSAVPVIVPEDTEPVIGRLLPNPVIELTHWATHELVDGTRITAVPARHRGGRLSQLRYTGANAYVVQKGDHSFFFCGDSAYGPHFKEIGNLYHLDMAYLPMGSYRPRWLMKSRHMTPPEAVQAFEDIRARYMMPVHWGTFRLSWERPDASRKWLEDIIAEQPERRDRILLTEPGGNFTVPAYS